MKNEEKGSRNSRPAEHHCRSFAIYLNFNCLIPSLFDDETASSRSPTMKLYVAEQISSLNDTF